MDVEQRNSHSQLVEVESHLAVPVTAEYMHLVPPGSFTPRYVTERNVCTCTPQKTWKIIFIAAFIIIRPNWKAPECPAAAAE